MAQGLAPCARSALSPFACRWSVAPSRAHGHFNCLKRAPSRDCGIMLSPSCRSPLAPSEDAMRGAAIWHEQLRVWLGHTLVEQAPRDAESVVTAEEVEEDGSGPSSSTREAPNDAESVVTAEEVEEDGSGSSSSAREAADEGTKEIAVQCCPEDMLEPLARSAFGMKRFIQRLEMGSPTVSWCVAPYQVDSHFSRFEEPDVVVRLAGALQGAELLHLADLFLGSGIGGVPVKRHPYHPRRRVADRHVVEATLLCEKMPGFRVALMSSSARLLMGGVQERKAPLDGRSLVTMAKEDNDMWGILAVTALDFAARLMAAGALPTAFAAELLRHCGEVGMTTAELSKGMLTIVMLATASGQSTSKVPYESEQPVRTQSAPAPSRPHDGQPLARTRSHTDHGCSGRGRVRCERGTLLRPHDDFQPYSSVSVAFVGCGKTAHTVFESTIPACDLADYWRFATGGDNEARAMEAEEEFRAQEKFREQEEQDLDLESAGLTAKSLEAFARAVPVATKPATVDLRDNAGLSAEAGGAALATLARKSPELKDSWTATLAYELAPALERRSAPPPRTQATSDSRPNAGGVESRRQVSCFWILAWILGPCGTGLQRLARS
jgi:hypothetical protein